MVAVDSNPTGLPGRVALAGPDERVATAA